MNDYFQAISDNSGLASIYVNLTTKCNLDCKHCYRAPERRTGSHQELPRDLLEAALGDAKALGALWVTFSGGEPLLHPEWKRILEMARDLGFAVSLSTNASLIDGQTAAFLADLPIYNIKTTMLGMTEEVHDSLAQRPGSFRKTVSAIQALRERDVNVTVSMTAMADNVRQIPDFVLWAKGLGAVPMVDPHLSGMLDGRLASPALRASDEDLRWLLLHPVMEEFLEGSEAVELRPEDAMAKQDGNDTLCTAGHLSISLNADGSLWPCVTWPLDLGNLRDVSLKDVWRGSEKLAWVRSLRRSMAGGCVGCKVRHACVRCPGMAAAVHGDPLAVLDESCRIARIKSDVLAERTPISLSVPGLTTSPSDVTGPSGDETDG